MPKATSEPIAPSGAGSRFTLHYIGHEAVLFDAIAQRLYALNGTAAFIWTCFEQSMSPQEIADRLCSTFGFAPTVSQAHVRDVMAAWHDLSLAARPAPPSGSPLAALRRDGALGSPSRAVRRPDGEPAFETTVRLLDSVFRLRLWPAAPAAEVARALAMVTASGDGEGAIGVDIAEGDEGFAMVAGGAVLDRCRRPDQVLPMVTARLTELALHRSSDLFALHAAAVSRDGRGLLLPGETGCGKSTLAAALAAEGLSFLGDDTIVLARDLARVRPIALPICLPSGSWPLLATRYPSLDTLATHARNDGKQVRYVLPPTPAPRCRVSWIVFARRTPTAPSGLTVLPKPAGLVRLMEGLCPLGEGLDAATVERFVRWTDDIAFFEMRYASLDDAVSELTGLSA